MRLQEQFLSLRNKTTPKHQNNSIKQINMETHWPEKGGKPQSSWSHLSRTLLICQYKPYNSFQNFSFCCISATTPLSFSEQHEVLWLKLQFYLFLSQLNFFSQRTELLSSQQLTFTAARGKLGQLGKEKPSTNIAVKRRGSGRKMSVSKGPLWNTLSVWGHLQSKQRELHSPGTEAARAFQQLSCGTAMAWISNTHRDP